MAKPGRSKMPGKGKVGGVGAKKLKKLEASEEKEEDVAVGAVGADEWLGKGDGAEGDDDLGVGSGSDDQAGDEDASDEEGGDEDSEGGGAGGNINEEGQDDDKIVPATFSKHLQKMAEEGGMDLSKLKQKIQDDATLLSNWRKAKTLGDKRSRDQVFAALVSNCSTYFSYSEELAEYFLQMFSPETAIKFFEANEQQRPLTIRTNSLKTRRSTLITAMQARKANVDPIGDWTKVGCKVYESQVPIGATPEYLGGQYMIQSASSLVPVMALAPQQNESILDMAAAPGGKTTYIGQLMRNTGTLFANDLRPDRCKSLMANIHRMGLTNTIVTALDGKKLCSMLPKMDRVLLDAPCSGSGIIARDPSIKVKRGAQDFEAASALQKALLMTAIDLVDATSKTGGYIVYSTCSLSIEENECVIDHALKARNVEVVSFSNNVAFGVEAFTKFREKRFHPSIVNCRRYYPHVHNMDGFFVAKLRKTSNDVPERIKKDRSHTDKVTTWGEEKWTTENMDTVMDFTPKEATAADAKAAKKMNKFDRKKLRRVHLQPKAGAYPDEVAKEPEAEPKPKAEKGGKGKKRKAAAEGSKLAAVGSEEAGDAKKKKKGLKKKTKGSSDAAPADAPAASATAPAEAAPAPKKKKKKLG